MKFVKNRKRIAGLLIVGLTIVSVMGVLHAQPDANDLGKGENPAAQKGGRGANRGVNRNMTPEQREAARQKREQENQARRSENLRRNLTQSGFAEKSLQDAVVEFVNAQDDQRDDSRDKVRQLSQAVRQNANDQTIAALLNEIRAENQTAKNRRQAALNALDAKIGYSAKPRLEAVLTLAGVVGENPAGPSGWQGQGGRGVQGGQNRRGGPNDGGPNNGPRPADDINN